MLSNRNDSSSFSSKEKEFVKTPDGMVLGSNSTQTQKQNPGKIKTKNSSTTKKKTGSGYSRAASRKTYSAKKDNKLKVIVLGGLEEVGRNMTLLEYNKEIIIIDMGLQFPEEDMPGIDYIIPNIDYLQGKEDWVKGVVITHGHYDHIGAIPHFMEKIGNPPLFTGELSAGLIKKRWEDFRRKSELNLQIINEKSHIKLGRNFQVDFLRVNHSIPDCFAVIINTPVGKIIHTGDFKIDYSPVNDRPADLNRIAQIGGELLKFLMSDSTDATH